METEEKNIRLEFELLSRKAGFSQGGSRDCFLLLSRVVSCMIHIWFCRQRKLKMNASRIYVLAMEQKRKEKEQCKKTETERK